MFKNVTPKAIALGGISFAALGVIGIGVEVTKAVTFEIQKARAAMTAALADIESAKAAMQSAYAERDKAAADKLRAENELLASKITRDAAVLVGQLLAQAQRDSAAKSAEGLVDATGVDKYVDNQIYAGVTSQFVEPVKVIKALNTQIYRLRREAETGIEFTSRRFLTEAERADRLAHVRILEEEKKAESDTSSATISDMFGVMMKGASRLIGGLDALNPTGASRISSDRRIIQEP